MYTFNHIWTLSPVDLPPVGLILSQRSKGAREFFVPLHFIQQIFIALLPQARPGFKPSNMAVTWFRTSLKMPLWHVDYLAHELKSDNNPTGQEQLWPSLNCPKEFP